MSAGYPVVNGIQYYPQLALWKRLDPGGVRRDVYNRYQHLSFSLDASLTENGLDLKSPVPDQVHATVNPAKFDFHNTIATQVLAPRHLSENLILSEQLVKVSTNGDWDWWSIRPQR